MTKDMTKASMQEVLAVLGKEHLAHLKTALKGDAKNVLGQPVGTHTVTVGDTHYIFDRAKLKAALGIK